MPPTDGEAAGEPKDHFGMQKGVPFNKDSARWGRTPDSEKIWHAIGVPFKIDRWISPALQTSSVRTMLQRFRVLDYRLNERFGMPGMYSQKLAGGFYLTPYDLICEVQSVCANDTSDIVH